MPPRLSRVWTAFTDATRGGCPRMRTTSCDTVWSVSECGRRCERNATASSPKQPSNLRRHGGWRKSGHRLRSRVSDIIAVIAVSYRRSRKALRRSRATRLSATLHGWRKELKTLWYQLRLAKPLTSGVAPLIAQLKRLETDLGDDHNLVVLAATLRGCRELRTVRAHVREVERLAARMRHQLRQRAFTLGRRLHARKPEAFARWLRVSSMKRRPGQTTAA